jgi:hypothetical protein
MQKYTFLLETQEVSVKKCISFELFKFLFFDSHCQFNEENNKCSVSY